MANKTYFKFYSRFVSLSLLAVLLVFIFKSIACISLLNKNYYFQLSHSKLLVILVVKNYFN